MDTSPAASPLLFCFLGAADYVPVHYQLQAQRTEEPETYVQAALCQLAPCRPARALVAATTKASETHRTALSSRLAELGVPVEFLSIKDGASDAELWETFQTLTAAIPEHSRVLFDATHGLRSLPLLGLLAMQFLRHARCISVDAVYYGAFEVLGRADHVRAKLARDESIGAAPIFDLTPLVALPAWTEAVASWETTGRPDLLVSAALPFTAPIKQAQRQHAPRALVELPASLQLLGDALRLTRHDRVALLAQQVRDHLEQVRQQLPPYPHLAPLDRVVERLDLLIAPLAASFDPSLGEGSAAYLRGQEALARWYIDHGDLTQAFAILREALASCAVGCAALAGAPFSGSGWASSKEREACLRSATRSTAREQTTPPTEPFSVRFEAWLDQHPDLGRRFVEAEEACRAPRNKLSHAWTGDEHTREKFTEESLNRCRHQARAGLDALGRLISAFAAVSAEKAPPPAPTDQAAPSAKEARAGEPAGAEMSAPTTTVGVFVNLSNHPVAGWSPEQRQAAQALGLGEPLDLPGGMPLVEPEADEAAVEALAERLAKQAASVGARGAHVAGEFTLTVALIAALQRRGVPCFAATTRREVTEERQPDGQVRRVQLFRFVGWRRYASVGC